MSDSSNGELLAKVVGDFVKGRRDHTQLVV